MTDSIEALRARVNDIERNANSSRWLFRQLWKKLRHFPRDASRRLRRSLRKRRRTLAPTSTPASARTSTLLAGVFRDVTDRVHVCRLAKEEFRALCRSHPEVSAQISELDAYLGSEMMREQIAQAVALDPNVGRLEADERVMCVPWQDDNYQWLREARNLLPAGPFDAVILVPFGKLGGADYVAGVLALALVKLGRTIILRTDAADWERPDWYPEQVASVDLSGALAKLNNKSRALYVLLQELAPKRIYNVNSRLCFELFADFGARLALRFQLYAYYFCADRSKEGIEVGYPIWYFANIIPHLTAALIDTADLAETLASRYMLPPEIKKKLCTAYTPALTSVREPPIVALQAVSRASRRRPRLLWAGRLDKQKRFDILLQVARSMPDIDFDCWGKAVLDTPPDLDSLPGNVVLHPPFKTYEELPLADSDGWIYTSAWDGLPTLLIECAALGLPITASAVGGVPELIDEETGWPVLAADQPAAYVAALREMLSDDKARIRKVNALQSKIRARHSVDAYIDRIREI